MLQTIISFANNTGNLSLPAQLASTVASTAMLSGLAVFAFGVLNKLDKYDNNLEDSSKLNIIFRIVDAVAHTLGNSYLGQFGGKCLDIVSDKVGLTGAISNYREKLAATIPIQNQSLRNIFAYHLVKSGLKKEHTVYDEKGAKYFTIFREKTKEGSTGIGVKFHKKPSNCAGLVDGLSELVFAVGFGPSLLDVIVL